MTSLADSLRELDRRWNPENYEDSDERQVCFCAEACQPACNLRYNRQRDRLLEAHNLGLLKRGLPTELGADLPPEFMNWSEERWASYKDSKATTDD